MGKIRDFYKTKSIKKVFVAAMFGCMAAAILLSEDFYVQFEPTQNNGPIVGYYTESIDGL